MDFALQIVVFLEQDNFDDFSATWWSLPAFIKERPWLCSYQDFIDRGLVLNQGPLVVKLWNCYLVNRNWIYIVSESWSRISVCRGHNPILGTFHWTVNKWNKACTTGGTRTVYTILVPLFTHDFCRADVAQSSIFFVS